MNLVAKLHKLMACNEAIRWARKNQSTPAKMWKSCPRGDWMLWLAARVDVDRKQLVMAACACARLVLHLVPAGEDRPRKAIEAAEAWCRGEVSLAKVRRAANAAYAAAACADAAYAAAAAAYAATAYATDADARTRMHRKCAIQVAKHISWRDVVAGLEGVEG